jgi:hypothetical protein
LARSVDVKTPLVREGCATQNKRMAIHDNVRSMSIEVIEEYLTIAEHCINTRKSDGGIYGYPAVLLLCCVIDALSNYAGLPKNTLLALQTMAPGLTKKQIKDLKSWYRNLLSHQAIIMPGTQISADPAGAPFEFAPTGEPTHIRVIPLSRLVRSWWDSLDKATVAPRFEQRQPPRHSFNSVFGSYSTSSKS